MDYIELVAQIAKEYSLDPSLVCAVCEQESNWDTYAVRFEPAFLKRYIHPVHPETPTTEELTSAMSFGLMQVMGEVAQGLGFKGRFLTALCDPDCGLNFGCRKLKECLDRAKGDVRQALLYYNGGGNKAYPDEVMARMEKYDGNFSTARNR